ncbi:MAG: urease accessory protein UreF, partial [Nitrososphaera sp.]
TSHEFHLMQLADSFFPSGMFSLSGGLEPLVRTGRVKDSAGVAQFIRQQLHFQLAPCDCVVMLAVMDAARKNDIASALKADNACYSMKMVSGVRTASTRSGRQLLKCIVHIAPSRFARQFHKEVESGQSAGTQPACLAIAAYSLGIPKKSALRLMLYSYSVSIVSAALRLGLLQHFDGQKLLTELGGDIDGMVVKSDIDELWQLSPLVDILQMRHEHDELRMFIT